MEEQLKKFFSFYQNEVLPKIKTIKEVTQTDYWYHWLLTHTEWVVFRWTYYALSIGENPIPVIFACASHDLARTNDQYNEFHWPNAVPIVTKLMNMFWDLLTNQEKEQIKYAVKNHTTWKKAPDYISACLRDADRTRLSWTLWYEGKFFNTEIAKKIASQDAKIFLEMENECLWRKKNDDREWILERQIEQY